MSTKSPEGKAAFHASNAAANILGQLAKGLEKEMKSSKKQKEQNLKNSFLVSIVQTMHDYGASEQTVLKALPGLKEYIKCLVRKHGSQASSKSGHPQSASTFTEEAMGLFLSEIEVQEVRWLWEKRVPLGKITILDGDPGMGKSMLAINIAARVSTGQPMPDGTAGTQGGVILIAPEDGAGDTLRPRLEAAGGDPSQVLLLNLVESLDVKKVKVNDRPFSLSQDLEVLEAEILRTKAVLVILDPLTAVLGRRLAVSRDQDV